MVKSYFLSQLMLPDTPSTTVVAVKSGYSKRFLIWCR